jgi:Sulfatase-modifying factor enzyme 1
MRYRYSVFIVFILMVISSDNCICQDVYSIPAQTFDPYKVLGPKKIIGSYVPFGSPPKSMWLNMGGFEISKFITYGQYKEYLAAIKKDSTRKFYLSQMPDTTMCLRVTYENYVTGNKYDNNPVMGIAWGAAMNYCKWKTIQNNSNVIKYIYRLACESEWLAAYYYLTNASMSNDFNQNYSDWLLNSFDEDAVETIDIKNKNHWNNFDYIYLSVEKDPNVLKRKCAIGDSYLYKLESLSNYSEIGYYSYQGYRQVGFRYVREIVDTVKLTDKYGEKMPSVDSKLLQNWGLK